MPQVKDSFANKFYGSVTESAANTLTFSEIQTNISVMDKVAWVIHRLEWYLTPAQIALIADDQDAIQMALVSSQQITALGLDNPAVIDMQQISKGQATAVGYTIRTIPFTRGFESLPGGGLIIAPRPLFIAIKGTGLASAGGVSVRGYYTARELKADEYLELVDYYRIVS